MLCRNFPIAGGLYLLGGVSKEFLKNFTGISPEFHAISLEFHGISMECQESHGMSWNGNCNVAESYLSSINKIMIAAWALAG